MPRSDEVHVALEQTSSVLNYLRTKLGVTSEVSVMSECELDFWATSLLASPCRRWQPASLAARLFVGGLVVVRKRLAGEELCHRRESSCQLCHEVEAR
jgi:hypothetical protein